LKKRDEEHKGNFLEEQRRHLMNLKAKETAKVSFVIQLQEVSHRLQEASRALSDLVNDLKPCLDEPQGTDQALTMTQAVYDQIRRTIGRQPAETGGLLGGRGGVVTHFHFDDTARRTRATYSPDHETLNRLLQDDWNLRGIRLVGFVHSHPPGINQPSGGDLTYAQEILRRNPHLDRLLLPIILSESDAGRFELFPFAAIRDENMVRVTPLKLELCDEPGWRLFSPAETFRRVRDAYDLDRLTRSRLIAVGTGGAAAFIEELARAGVGQFVLIDPDVVSETNLATQQAYRKDIGRPKVDCLAERIWDINPQAIVMARQTRLDEIKDEEFARLAKEPLAGQSPEVTLLCGLTDSFEAQARINRLALHFGLPSLCAQVYHEGRGAEITFTYPGITPACHRCALSSRYRAYLEKGFRNNVTSDGTPIFATTRLNALKGFIALAILHYGTHHLRWGGLLERIGPRNLIQIRMDPDVSVTLGLRAFDRVLNPGEDTENAAWRRDRILFDEAIWLPQKPDCPENGFPTCPDCGGTGDLRQAIGTFSDTRIMRLHQEINHVPVPARQ